MPNFNTGKLNTNKVYAAIYNMILNQVVNSKNISKEYAELVNAAKEDVGLFGDMKLYYETYKPAISDWKGDDESTDLLETKKYRVKSPECQALVINIYKKVVLVLDKFLTKQAWMQEGAFSEFNSVMTGWIRDVIDLYEINTYNSFVGTEESSVGKQQREIDLTTIVGAATGEEKARLEAQAIERDFANLVTDLMDNTKDYIDYGSNGMVRGFSRADLVRVMPASVANTITKFDTPSLFHGDKVGLDASQIKTVILPDRYFGKVNEAATKGKADGTVRSRIYQDAYDAGDAITSTAFEAPANTSYTLDDKILYKVFHKKSCPWLSAFEAAGSFYNCQALNEKYVTVLGHNTLEHLAGKPCITVRKK